MAYLRNKLSFISSTHNDKESTSSWTQTLRSRASAIFFGKETQTDAQLLDADELIAIRVDRTEPQSPILSKSPLLFPYELPKRGSSISAGSSSPPNNKFLRKRTVPDTVKPRKSNLALYAEAFRSSVATLPHSGSSRLMGSVKSCLRGNAISRTESPNHVADLEDAVERGMPPSTFTEPFPDYVEAPVSPYSALEHEIEIGTSGALQVPGRLQSDDGFRRTERIYPNLSSSGSKILAGKGSQHGTTMIQRDSGYFSMQKPYGSSAEVTPFEAEDGNREAERSSTRFAEDSGYLCDGESDATSNWPRPLCESPVYPPLDRIDKGPVEDLSNVKGWNTDSNFSLPSFTFEPFTLEGSTYSSEILHTTPCGDMSVPKVPSQPSRNRVQSEAYEADNESERRVLTVRNVSTSPSKKRLVDQVSFGRRFSEASGSESESDDEYYPNMGPRTAHRMKLADRARRYEQIMCDYTNDDDVELVGNIKERVWKPFYSPSGSSEDLGESSNYNRSSSPVSNAASAGSSQAASGSDPVERSSGGKPTRRVLQLLFFANMNGNLGLDDMLEEYDSEWYDELERCYNPQTKHLYTQRRNAGSFVAAKLPSFGETS